MPHPLNHRANNKGLTLIEVMIAVAVIGALAGIAWPMFKKQMARQQVSDAVITLTTIQTRLERCLLDTGTYSGCTPCGTTNAPSEEGNYKITVKCDATLNAYKAIATPNSSIYGQTALGLTSLGHKIGPWP